MHQKNDVLFTDLLNTIRVGNVHQSNENILRSRLVGMIEYSKDSAKNGLT